MPTGGDAFARLPIRSGSTPVAWVISHGEPVEQLEADARLIAAAPDLLALARKYASECGNCNGRGEIGGLLPGDGGYQSDPCDHCADIREVIAKAVRP